MDTRENVAKVRADHKREKEQAQDKKRQGTRPKFGLKIPQGKIGQSKHLILPMQ